MQVPLKELYIIVSLIFGCYYVITSVLTWDPNILFIIWCYVFLANTNIGMLGDLRFLAKRKDTFGDSTVTVVEVRLSQSVVARHTWAFSIAPSSLSLSDTAASISWAGKDDILEKVSLSQYEYFFKGEGGKKTAVWDECRTEGYKWDG